MIFRTFLTELLEFCYKYPPLTYLCEAGFSALNEIKQKKRDRLKSVGVELRVSLALISPRLKKLCSVHRFKNLFFL